LIIYIGYGWVNVLGYMVLTAGFYMNFYKLKPTRPSMESTK